MAVSRLAKVLINLALIPNLLIASTIDQGNCLDVEDLGTNNVDRYDYSIRMDVDSACDYTLEIKMKHDDTLPIPSDANHCNPTVLPPIFASDGLPYYAMRWQYASVPRDIKAATGIDHVSIDFNPCGHPPVDVFTIPHYDLHLYLVDPDYRKCMTCETIPGAPVCNPGGQSTPSGQGFFNAATIMAGPDATKLANMPSGFEYQAGDSVPLMGGHAWDSSQQPSGENPWINPIWIMGPYDGTIVDYEPMIPLSFIQGNIDNVYEENLSYAGQTINNLPNKYTVAYNATSAFFTVTFTGKSDVCNHSAKSQKKAKKGKKVRN